MLNLEDVYPGSGYCFNSLRGQETQTSTQRKSNRLKLINSDTFSKKVEKKQINKPSRTWVNKVIQKIDPKLSRPIIIDNKRFMSCELCYFCSTREHGVVDVIEQCNIVV